MPLSLFILVISNLMHHSSSEQASLVVSLVVVHHLGLLVSDLLYKVRKVWSTYTCGGESQGTL